MAKDKNTHDWAHDFVDFANQKGQALPEEASQNILAKVRADLSPSVFLVFFKTAAINFFVGCLTILYCPQFGLSLTSSMGLMHYLMKYGDSVCMLGCGAFFTGVGLLVVSLVLRPEEIRVLKEHQVLNLTFIASLSLGALLCLGGQVALSMGFVWALGAIIGGALSLELGWVYRKKLAKGFS